MPSTVRRRGDSFHLPPYGPGPQQWHGQQPVPSGAGNQPNSVPHNYGAPPDWRPATTPSGQSWPPDEKGQWPRSNPSSPWQAPPATGPGSNGHGDGSDTPQEDGGRPAEDGPR